MPVKEKTKTAVEHNPKSISEVPVQAVAPVAGTEAQKKVAATLQLIVDRNYGCRTPVEHFIENLVFSYDIFEKRGLGLPLELIEQEMEDLRRSLPEAIKTAHFLVARYPVEQQSTPEALTEQTVAPVIPIVTDQPESKLTVMLTTVGSNKIEAIKAVRAVTGLGLKESKDLVDAVAAGTPKSVKDSVSKDEGASIAKKFVDVGATAEVK